jgi:hypothetical protein
MINMMRSMQVLLSVLTWLVVFLSSTASSVSAIEDYVVIVGQDKIFTEFNYYNAWFTSDYPPNPEPIPASKEAYAEGSMAHTAMSADPGYAGRAFAEIGVNFQWDLGQSTWDEVKNRAIKVTIEFSYYIEAYWIADYGCANAGIIMYEFLSGGPPLTPGLNCYDWIGRETGDSGSRGNSTSITFTTTADGRPLTVETLGDAIILLVNSQAQSPYKEDEQGNPIGINQNSSANVVINSIRIEFIDQFMIVNVGSGYCLSATDLNPKSHVILYDCDSSTNQIFTYNDDNTIRINDKMCLDTMPLYNWLIIDECNNSSSQKWVFDLAGGIINAENGAYVTVGNNSQNRGTSLNHAPKMKPKNYRQKFAPLQKGEIVEQCFGGIGGKCAGVPQVNGLVVKRGPRNVDGTQMLSVAVGSIAHDTCCLDNPTGYFCREEEPVFPSRKALRTRLCVREWVKAVQDTTHGRSWEFEFGPYSAKIYTDNLDRLAPTPNRRYMRPTRTGNEMRAELKHERMSTRRLAAPKGTRIHWGDKDFCKSRAVEYDANKKSYVCK